MKKTKKIESKAIALFKAARKVSGYAIGIGEHIHEGTFAALSGYPKSKRGWMIDAVSNLDDIEGRVLTKLLCDHKISMPIATATLYTEVNFTGNGIEVSLEDHSCKDIQGLLDGKNLSSLQNHKQCIALYNQPGCMYGLRTVFEDQAGVLNLNEDRYRRPYRYIRPCETAQPTTDKRDYVTWYITDNYSVAPNDLYRPTDGRCLPLDPQLKMHMAQVNSIKLYGNCIILFDNDNCAPSLKAQRIAQDNPNLSDLPQLETKSFKFFN